MPPSHYDPTSPDEQTVPLPSAPFVTLASNAILQPPLTRRGHGPGLIVFLPPKDSFQVTQRTTKCLDPEPVQKWAEEGFAVLAMTNGGGWTAKDALDSGIKALLGRNEVDIMDKVGIVGVPVPLTVYDPKALVSILEAISTEPRVVCVVSYGAHLPNSSLPLLSHTPGIGTGSPNSAQAQGSHTYATSSQFFVLPQAADYNGGSAAVAHTRSLVFLRKHIGGPHFDLEAIWDEHTLFEFGERSVAKTMGTMVAEPYVNHVPTMTGGMGRENLTAFYRDHFIFSNPADTALEPVSRTVGADRIIDEFIFTMTHDKVVDWLLPGVPPSGKKVHIPMLSLVNVRGDRLFHEHIWWDQATALLQVGAIPQRVPYPLHDERETLRLPISGAESAKLLADESAGGSNTMLGEGWGVTAHERV